MHFGGDVRPVQIRRNNAGCLWKCLWWMAWENPRETDHFGNTVPQCSTFLILSHHFVQTVHSVWSVCCTGFMKSWCCMGGQTVWSGNNRLANSGDVCALQSGAYHFSLSPSVAKKVRISLPRCWVLCFASPLTFSVKIAWPNKHEERPQETIDYPGHSWYPQNDDQPSDIHTITIWWQRNCHKCPRLLLWATLQSPMCYSMKKRDLFG